MEGLLPCVAIQPCNAKRLRERAQLVAAVCRGKGRLSKQQAQPYPLFLGRSSIAPYRREPAAQAPAAVRERRTAPPSRAAVTRCLKDTSRGTATQGTPTV